MHRLDTFPSKELIQNYRAMFSTKNGAEVFYHILYELGYFEDKPSLTAEDAALKNYASRLINILGGGEVGPETVKLLLKGLFAQPLPEPKKDEYLD